MAPACVPLAHRGGAIAIGVYIMMRTRSAT